MSIAQCDQLASTNQAGSANAGLTGASSLLRSTEGEGHVFRKRFTFTIPASGAGSAQGDQIDCRGSKPTSRIYAVRVITNGLGAGVTLAIGKIDNNNAANNDNNHYLLPTPAANAGTLDANLNLSEQMGTDPTGADTDTGDAPPGFGNAGVDVVLTIGGAAPTAGQKIQGWFDYMPGT